MSSTTVPIFSASVGHANTLDLRASCQFTISRNVTTLFKEYLMIIEQLAEEHDEAMEKLYSALPPEYKEYVNLADHFTEEKYDRIRRAVLARGNDCDRAIKGELDKYQITFCEQPSKP